MSTGHVHRKKKKEKRAKKETQRKQTVPQNKSPAITMAICIVTGFFQKSGGTHSTCCYATGTVV